MVREHNLRNNKNVLVIGNGDIKDLVDGEKKWQESNCDGLMIGRGAFGKPWLFSGREVTLEERFKIMLEHTKLFEETLVGVKNFSVMKKHFKAYVNGFPGASELRSKLMETNSFVEVEEITKKFLN